MTNSINELRSFRCTQLHFASLNSLRSCRCAPSLCSIHFVHVAVLLRSAQFTSFMSLRSFASLNSLRSCRCAPSLRSIHFVHVAALNNSLRSLCNYMQAKTVSGSRLFMKTSNFSLCH